MLAWRASCLDSWRWFLICAEQASPPRVQLEYNGIQPKLHRLLSIPKQLDNTAQYLIYHQAIATGRSRLTSDQLMCQSSGVRCCFPLGRSHDSSYLRDGICDTDTRKRKSGFLPASISEARLKLVYSVRGLTIQITISLGKWVATPAPCLEKFTMRLRIQAPFQVQLKGVSAVDDMICGGLGVRHRWRAES